MYVIGLTGGIASGKSTAAQTLRQLGAEVIDADAISRQLTAPDGAAAPAILDRFGTLDRRALGRIVFGNSQARQDLNRIVHPMVQAEMEARIEAATAPIVVLDVPLLFESGMDYMADEIWVVYVSYEEQVRRVMARDGLSEDEAVQRIDSQMPTREKLRRAQAGINTSGTFEETRVQIESLYNAALAKVGIHRLTAGPGGQPRRRNQARRIHQHDLEAQATMPQLAHTRPFEPLPRRWEDTSTLLDIPEQRTFFSRQPPLFWAAVAVLLLGLLIVLGIVGVNAWRDYQAEQAEKQRLEELAAEKARYPLLYQDYIDQHSAANGLDPALVAAIIYNESRFDPEAVSYLGARGLMQIMEDTGSWIAGHLGEKSEYTGDLLFVPEFNIRYGTWYLGYLSRLFDGDMVRMAAGYHAGQNRVQSWLDNPEYSADGVTLDVIPFSDTDTYVQRVVNTYEIYYRHYYAPEEPTQSAA